MFFCFFNCIYEALDPGDSGVARSALVKARSWLNVLSTQLGMPRRLLARSRAGFLCRHARSIAAPVTLSSIAVILLQSMRLILTSWLSLCTIDLCRSTRRRRPVRMAFLLIEISILTAWMSFTIPHGFTPSRIWLLVSMSATQAALLTWTKELTRAHAYTVGQILDPRTLFEDRRFH